MNPDEHVSPQEARDARNPSVGGTDLTPAAGLLARQPVLALLLLVLLPDLAVFGEALVAGEPVRAAAAALFAALVAAAGRVAHQAVTPLADPKVADGLPLTLKEN